MVEIVFESGGTPYPDGMEWREMTAYERELVGLLLAGLAEYPRPTATARVRQMDECGCLEFAGVSEDGSTRVLAEAKLPDRHPMYPLEVMLTMRGDEICWLEFIHYGQGYDRKPPVRDFVVTHR